MPARSDARPKGFDWRMQMANSPDGWCYVELHRGDMTTRQVRRIHALRALGWTYVRISREVGWSLPHVAGVCQRTRCVVRRAA